MKAALVSGPAVSRMVVRPTPTGSSRQAPLAAIEAILKEVLYGQSVAAVGVCLKGIVDPESGILVGVNESLAGLIGVPLQTTLSEALGLPVTIENDARMYALGELAHGAGRGADSLVCVTLGTGIGTGVAIGRRILRGRHGVLGNLGGHFTTQVDGPRCTCGNVGCLEALIGRSAIERDVQAVWRATRTHEDDSPRDLFVAARAGDEIALGVVHRVTRQLAAGVVSLVHAYDPDLVVLGGGLMASADLIVPPVQAYLDAHAWTHPRGRVRVDAAGLGDAAALVGIGELALYGHPFI